MEQDSIIRIKQLHPLLVQPAYNAYMDAVKATPVGVHPYITETYRSFAESDRLWEQGRTTPGPIVSWAKGGESYHNYGLALDFCLQIDGKNYWPEDPTADKNWMIVVDCFKRHGFTWGGDFPKGKEDYPHFENKLGYNWRDLLALHSDKSNFIGDGPYLKLLNKTVA